MPISYISNNILHFPTTAINPVNNHTAEGQVFELLFSQQPLQLMLEIYPLFLFSLNA